MMKNRREFSEEELTGFLDGELDEKTSADITAQLANDVGLNKRIAALDMDKAQLGNSFSMLLDAAPPMPKISKIPSKRTNYFPTRTNFTGIAAGLFALAGIASMLVAYLISSDNSRQDWTDYVAAYHALYVTQTLSGVADSVEIQNKNLKKTSSALGRNISLTTLTGHGELDYKRSQILGFGGRAIAQMTFLTPLGAPIALCIIRSSVAKSSKFSEMENMAAASWSQSGYAFLLIGGEDREMIERAALYFRAKL